jgi:Na+-translocating ferredoxin:NAD+ oxidoreductase RNF subunit RnfB
MSILQINTERCQFCNSCVRACPVNAIQTEADKNFAFIDAKKCILCGNCLSNCQNEAIEYKTDIDNTEKLLKSKSKVAAIVDPSIAAEFPDVTDYRNFVGMIRSLGFDYVHEVSFGVDLVADKLKKLWTKNKGKYYINSFCPPVVEYIRKYQPQLIDSLTPLVSPMIATARIIRKEHDKNTKIVYIGPCLAQKQEALDYSDENLIDTVLGFKELRQMFQRANLNENSVEYSEFDPPHGNKGSLYPICTGILEAGNIKTDLLDSHIISIENRNRFTSSLDEFAEIPSIKHHLNIFYCGACSKGPLTTHEEIKPLQKHALVVDFAQKRIEILNIAFWKANMKKYQDIPLSRHFTIDDQRVSEPDEEKINEILLLLGKDSPMNLNCGMCGQETCHQFAVNVAKNLSKTEMCIPFLLRNKQEYLTKLQQTNRQISKSLDTLKAAEKKSKEDYEASKEALQVTTSVMQKLPSGIVIVDKDLRIIQSNNRFIDILGDEARAINDIIPGLETADLRTLLPYQIVNLFTYVLENNKPIQNKDISVENNLLNIYIFTIKRKEIVGAIIRDLHEPTIRKEEVITRVREVIDNNLAMVQKIGFLLGEGASETEQMLNTIIESFSKERKKDEK